LLFALWIEYLHSFGNLTQSDLHPLEFSVINLSLGQWKVPLRQRLPFERAEVLKELTRQPQAWNATDQA
jgi:hypothetical protein